MGGLASLLRRHGVLLGLGLALSGALLWLRYDATPTGGGPAQAPLALAVVSDESTLQVLLDRASAPGAAAPREQLSLRRHQVRGGAEWWLDAPHVRADDAALEELLLLLREGRVLRRLPGARRDPGYGLAPPRLRLQVGAATLVLGADTPDGAVYAARGEEPDVLVLEGRLRDLLQRTRAELTRAQLTQQELEPRRVQRVDLGALTLTRRGPTRWQVQEHRLTERDSRWFAHEDDAARLLPRGQDRPPALAKTGASEALLRTLAEARAARVLGGNGVPFRLSDYRIRPAPLVLRVDGVEQLFAGLPCPAGSPREVGAALRDAGVADGGSAAEAPLGYVVRADGAQLCFKGEDLQPLLQASYDALREPRLLPFAAEEVQRLEIQREGESVLLHREGSSGFLLTVRGLDQPADAEAVQSYLTELLALEGESAPPLAGASPGREALTLLLETRGGERERLVLSPRQARRGQEEPMQLRDVAAAARVLAQTQRFVRPQLLRFAVYDVSALRSERWDSQGRPLPTEALRRVSEAGPLAERLRLREPGDLPADPERLARLLGALADLRVEQRRSPDGQRRSLARLTIQAGAVRSQVLVTLAESPAPARAAAPGCLVQVTALGEGAAGSDSRGGEAALATHATAGLLNPEACADLTAPLVDRRLLLLDDARLRRLEVRQLPAGPSLILERVGGALQRVTASAAAGSAGVPLSDAQRQGLLAPLRALARAEFVAHVSAPLPNPVLQITLVQEPLPLTARAGADVPMTHQTLVLAPDRAGLLAQAADAGDPRSLVRYRLPAAALPPLLAMLRPSDP